MPTRFTKDPHGVWARITSFFKPFRVCKHVSAEEYAIQKYKETLPKAKDTGPYPDASSAVLKNQKKLKSKQALHLKSKPECKVVDIKSRKANKK